MCGNGEGGIYPKGNYWEARIMVGYTDQGKPKIKTFTGKKRSIVAKRLNDFIVNRKRLEADIACNYTVAEWLRIWYEEYVTVNVKTSTRASYEGIINKQLIPKIGKIKLAELKKSHIEALYKELLTNGRADGKGGLSVKSVKNTAIVINKALNDAVAQEILIKNPASIAKIPGLHKHIAEKKQVEVLNRQEQQLLESACGFDGYEFGVYMLLNTGARLGELLAITWSDINFENGTLSINKQLNRLKDYDDKSKKTRLGIQNSTKTRTSTRIIPLPQSLITKLCQYRKWQDENKKALGSAYNDLDLVFAREDGNFIDRATFRCKFKKMLKFLGIKDVTLHALRHTFATRALESGAHIKTVSQLLGHASIQITLDTYSHVSVELKREAMEQIVQYKKSYSESA